MCRCLWMNTYMHSYIHSQKNTYLSVLISKWHVGTVSSRSKNCLGRILGMFRNFLNCPNVKEWKSTYKIHLGSHHSLGLLKCLRCSVPALGHVPAPCIFYSGGLTATLQWLCYCRPHFPFHRSSGHSALGPVSKEIRFPLASLRCPVLRSESLPYVQDRQCCCLWQTNTQRACTLHHFIPIFRN